MPRVARFLPLLLLSTALSLTAQPQAGGCPVFPLHNIWNTPIDKLPVLPRSNDFIATEGADTPLHPDFGPASSIPFTVVPATQPPVPIQIGNDESDPGPYPIPPDAPVEAGTDHHLLIVRQGECKLYEVWLAQKQADGTWTGGTGAIFDLRTNALRQDGWTSSDGAGLPIFAGLVRYDEVASGAIKHALRLTVPQTANYYVWPARHFASHLSGSQYPPMGTRFRLKANYDLSRFDSKVQVILQALKTYGMMVSDNGAAWYITGAPDSRWSNDVLAQLKQVKGSDLEAVDVSSLQAGLNSGLALDPGGSSRADFASSSAMSFDASAAPTVSTTLTGDVNAPTVANLTDGQSVSFLICQDADGGHAFAWPANVMGGMQVSTAPGTCSAQSFVSDGKKLYATTPGMTNM